MKRLFILFTLLQCAIASFAYDVIVDGIYYNLDKTNMTAAVTYRELSHSFNFSNYTGSIIIPSSIVAYDGKEYSVTSIDDYAFQISNSLTSVSVPETVTRIGFYAFSSCESLNSIVFPETSSLETIEDNVFIGCNSLKSISLPVTITHIGKYAFRDCRELISVVIPETSSMKAIEDGTFWGCWSLESVSIPNSVETIGFGAFDNSWNLESVTFPDSIKIIQNQAFHSCSSLISITIPESVTSIGASAFTSCQNLIYVSIPNSITSIEDNTFSGCESLSSIDIPNSVTSIGNRAFQYCSSLESFTIPNSVTSIGVNAFLGCKALTSLTVPSSVTSIGKWAFQQCDNLQNLTFLTENPPFSSYTELTKDNSNPTIFFPVEYEENYKAVLSPDKYKIVNPLPDNGSVSILKGDESLFLISIKIDENDSLTWKSSDPDVASVTISKNICIIKANQKGNASISYSNNAGTITGSFSVSVSDVEKIAVSVPTATIEKERSITLGTVPEIKNKTRITWTSSDEEIATVKDGVVTGVNYGTAYIKCTYDGILADSCKVTVYKPGLVYVGNIYYHLFPDLTAGVANCGDQKPINEKEQLEYSGTVNIPSAVTYDGVTYTVKTIRPYAFYKMKDLQAIIVPSTVEVIDTLAAAYSKQLAKVMFPNQQENLKTINPQAFYECSRLDDVHLPNTTLRIDREAFRYCTSLSTITFGNSLNFINEYAFADCPVLDNVEFPESLRSIQIAAFQRDVALHEITFPAQLQGIGAAAFSYCSALKETTFKTYNSTLTVGIGAFSTCQAMEKVNIEHLDSWAQINFSDETANPTSQAHHLYMDGAEVIDAYLPTSTKYINNYVFADCTSLKSVSIPSTVEYINDNILYGCTGLEKIVCHRQTPPSFLGTDNPEKMNDVFGKAALQVLDTSKNSYVSDSWWGRFTNIVGKNNLMQLVLTPQTLTIKTGETYKLHAAMIDETHNLDASGSVSWSSSDKTIATVKNDGTVTGVSLGTVTITCKSILDKSMISTCELTVVPDGLVKEIVLDKTSLSMNSGDAVRISTTILPESAENKTVKWTSSNIAVATVSSEGVVTAVDRGSALITCEARDGGGAKAVCQVSVTNNTGTKMFNPYTDYRQTRDVKCMFDVTKFGRYYLVNNWDDFSENISAMYVNGVEVTPTQYLDLYPGAYWVVYTFKEEMTELPAGTFLNMNGEEVDELKDSMYGMLTELHLPAVMSSIGSFNGYGCWYCADIFLYGQPTAIATGAYLFNISTDNPAGSEACGRYVDKDLKFLHVCANSISEEQQSLILPTLTGNGYTVVDDLTYIDPASDADDPEPDPVFILGDVDGDGVVDRNDVVRMIEYLTAKKIDGIVYQNLDLTQDGNVSVADLVALINKIH